MNQLFVSPSVSVCAICGSPEPTFVRTFLPPSVELLPERKLHYFLHSRSHLFKQSYESKVCPSTCDCLCHLWISLAYFRSNLSASVCAICGFFFHVGPPYPHKNALILKTKKQPESCLSLILKMKKRPESRSLHHTSISMWGSLTTSHHDCCIRRRHRGCCRVGELSHELR